MIRGDRKKGSSFSPLLYMKRIMVVLKSNREVIFDSEVISVLPGDTRFEIYLKSGERLVYPKSMVEVYQRIGE